MPGKHQHPLSPHLQIYRLPLPALASVCHRLSGIALALLIGAGLPSYLLALAYAPDMVDTLHSWSGLWWFVIIRFLVVLTLIYHTLSGIRHLAMDCGLWLEKNSSLLSAQVLFALALVLSVLLWVL